MNSERWHVVPHHGKWAVKREGVPEPETITPTQQAAIDWCQAQAEQHEGPVEVMVHGRNGRLRSRRVFERRQAEPTLWSRLADFGRHLFGRARPAGS